MTLWFECRACGRLGATGSSGPMWDMCVHCREGALLAMLDKMAAVLDNYWFTTVDDGEWAEDFNNEDVIEVVKEWQAMKTQVGGPSPIQPNCECIDGCDITLCAECGQDYTAPCEYHRSCGHIASVDECGIDDIDCTTCCRQCRPPEVQP